MKVSVTCRTCKHGEGGSGCAVGWCISYEKYESIIPIIHPIMRRNNFGKYYVTDEFLDEWEMRL